MYIIRGLAIMTCQIYAVMTQSYLSLIQVFSMLKQIWSEVKDTHPVSLAAPLVNTEVSLPMYTAWDLSHNSCLSKG